MKLILLLVVSAFCTVCYGFPSDIPVHVQDVVDINDQVVVKEKSDIKDIGVDGVERDSRSLLFPESRFFPFFPILKSDPILPQLNISRPAGGLNPEPLQPLYYPGFLPPNSGSLPPCPPLNPQGINYINQRFFLNYPWTNMQPYFRDTPSLMDPYYCYRPGYNSGLFAIRYLKK